MLLPLSTKKSTEINRKQRRGFSSLWWNSTPAQGEEGSKPRLDNCLWQVDLWPQHPAAPTAGWQVKLRKHSPLHLSVIFDLLRLSTMKSVCLRAKSPKCLLDESLHVCVWGPDGSSVSAIVFLPALFIPECHCTWEDWGLDGVSSQMTRPSVPRIEL